MPLDRSHQHISSDIMQADEPQTPINPSGGPGIPQGGPLTEDLDADEFAIVGHDGQFRVEFANSDYLLLRAQDDPSDPDVGSTAQVKVDRDGPSVVLEVLEDGQTVASARLNAGGLNVSGALITNLADPEGDQDAATKAYVDANAGGGLLSFTRDLAADDIATLSSVPVEVVAAPGAGKVIVPVAASFQYKAGTEPFAHSVSVQVRVNGANMGELSVALGTTVSEIGVLPITGVGNEADLDDAPMNVAAGDPPGFSGSILTASLGDAGTGYAPGDTGTIDNGLGGTLATYEIDTVGGGGEVETFTVTAAGTRYGVDISGTTVVTGAGDDLFTVDIDTITPLSDGTARLTVLYYVMDLLV